MTEIYQVIRTTEGYEEHTTDLTHKQATELIEDLSVFEDEQYEIHPQSEPTPPKREYRNIPQGACDGWEDLYNY